MGSELTQKPLDICPEGCPAMQADIETIVIDFDHAPSIYKNTLVCEHENACIMWSKKIGKVEE
jgi:hypothetical protein